MSTHTALASQSTPYFLTLEHSLMRCRQMRPGLAVEFGDMSANPVLHWLNNAQFHSLVPPLLPAMCVPRVAICLIYALGIRRAVIQFRVLALVDNCNAQIISAEAFESQSTYQGIVHQADGCSQSDRHTCNSHFRRHTLRAFACRSSSGHSRRIRELQVFELEIGVNLLSERLYGRR